MSTTERTYIMVKPEGVQRGLVGKIITRFEERGYKIVALKFLLPTEELLHKHYAEHVNKPFFAGLVKHMVSGPVAAIVFEGLEVVKAGRAMLGETKPLESPMGTIRGDYGLAVGRNIAHGSDSVDSANKEIALWFPEGTTQWQSVFENCVYE